MLKASMSSYVLSQSSQLAGHTVYMIWKKADTHLSRHVSGQKLVSARTREGMSLLH